MKQTDHESQLLVMIGDIYLKQANAEDIKAIDKVAF